MQSGQTKNKEVCVMRNWTKKVVSVFRGLIIDLDIGRYSVCD